jgi:CheY-like chemotaxis protein
MPCGDTSTENSLARDCTRASETGLRSVWDYESDEALFEALKSMRKRGGEEVGGDVPNPQGDPDSELDTPEGSPYDNLDWYVSNASPDSEEQSVETEFSRLRASCGLIGLKDAVLLDRLTGLAARTFGAPIAYVNVLDLGRQWLVSSRGLGGTRELPRKFSFCGHALLAKDSCFVIPDAIKDPRFINSPYVTGPPYIRMYSGATLRSPEGIKLGTFCILDTKPWPEGLNDNLKMNLEDLAATAADFLNHRRDKIERRNVPTPHQIIASATSDLLAPINSLSIALDRLTSDHALQERLSENQKELISMAVSGTGFMGDICQSSVQTYRHENDPIAVDNVPIKPGDSTIRIVDLVQSLHEALETFRKRVPLVISVDSSVPSKAICEEVKIFRSAMLCLHRACSRTISGSVNLTISARHRCQRQADTIELFFEFKVTGSAFIPEDQGGYNKKHFDSPTCTNDHAYNDDAEFLRLLVFELGSIGGEYSWGRQQKLNRGEDRPGDQAEVNCSSFAFSVPVVVPTGPDEKIGLKKLRDVDTDATDVKPPARPVESIFDLQAPAHPADYMVPKKKEKRALVVDGSIATRKSLTKLLEHFGFVVTIAANGIDAMKEMQGSFFDIVFCAFVVPVWDGIECVQQHRAFEREKRPLLPLFIVGMSSNANRSDIDKGLNAGMSTFVHKPVTPKIMRDLFEFPEFVRMSAQLDIILADDVAHSNDAEQELKPVAQPSREFTCLVATKTTAGGISPIIVERLGWHSAVVEHGESVVDLLKMRLWDVVLVDEHLPGIFGTGRINHFREWELEHRKERQNNLIFMSATCVRLPSGILPNMKCPEGFDGIMVKHLMRKDVGGLFQAVEDIAELTWQAESKNGPAAPAVAGTKADSSNMGLLR